MNEANCWRKFTLSNGMDIYDIRDITRLLRECFWEEIFKNCPFSKPRARATRPLLFL